MLGSNHGWLFSGTKGYRIAARRRCAAGTGQVPTFTFGQFSFADLSASIRALETKGLAKILAQPRIAVQNDHTASISIVNHIAIAIKTTYDDAGNIVSRGP